MFFANPDSTSASKLNQNGFTLIELLVVVSIILILIAIALPQFKEAQKKARIVQSKSYLRTIGQGLMSYKVDFNVFPPADGCAGPDPSPNQTCVGEGPAALGSWDGVPWVLADMGYVTDREYFYCPVMVGLYPDRKEKIRWAYNSSAIDTGFEQGGANNLERESGHLWLARCAWLPAFATFDPNSDLKYPLGDDLETGERDVMENVLRINGTVETVNGLREYLQTVNGR
ncbi:MAG: type II secretion system protein [Candidatus Omnitrophica bacterium]|nr:type II secretion system protein [Candidatus Omnitrophota bacterium]